ncbi:MAG: hypothetical protein BAJALOKI1v1_30046 [Promethearchaeota archaeon]|nr:MAG: hypothetical protein BAJALOKI1v1_30046 [Candidatus Lokiarchaeota archaeon]
MRFSGRYLGFNQLHRRMRFILFLISIFLLGSFTYGKYLTQNSTSITALHASDPFITSSEFIYTNDVLNISQIFQLLETSEDNGTILNNNSLIFDLETSRWNVSQLECNITDISFTNSIKTIEDNSQNSYVLYQNRDVLGVQIDLPVRTKIYKIWIYGEVLNQEDDSIDLQINGYNSANHFPNSTVYGEKIALNMSSEENWYLHEFSTPLELPKGNYSLLLNGFGTELEGYYRWYYNDVDPHYSELYSWRHENQWYKTQGAPFLYKLEQQIVDDFYPSELNMSADINGKNHTIEDTTEKNTGNLHITEGFFPNTTKLSIFLKNNLSDTLKVNLSYLLRLTNHFTSVGNIIIKLNSNNEWHLYPEFNRLFDNYSVIFEYPRSWSDLSLFRKNGNETEWQNVTHQIYITNEFVTIPNNTITPDTKWNISVTSPLIDLPLDPPNPEYEPGQVLQFSVLSPNSYGNFTFILVNSTGAKISQKIKQNLPEELIYFSYSISLDVQKDVWRGFIFWNNATDGGVQVFSFKIIISEKIVIFPNFSPSNTNYIRINPVQISLLLGIILFAIGIILTSFIGILKKKNKNGTYKQEIKSKAIDLLNLKDLIVIAKDSGLNVYEEHYSGRKIDPALISGFLDAIRAFGIEMTGDRQNTQLFSLEYKNSTVLMSEFKSFRLILILKEKPSSYFLDRITALSHEIEKNYGDKLRTISHNNNAFFGIHELIKKNLGTSFLLPLKINTTKNLNLNPLEKELLSKSKRFMKENNLDYFFVSFLVFEEEINAKHVEAIFSLIEKKIFSQWIGTEAPTFRAGRKCR